MAENVTNELMFETLKKMQGDMSSIRDEMKIMRGEMTAMKTHLLGLVQSDLTRDGEIAGIKDQLERINIRLGLRDSDA